MIWWDKLSEGQGSVIAALFTVLAAIVGVILGARFFGGKVHTFEQTLEASEERLRDFQAKLNDAVKSLTLRVGEIDDVMSSIQQATARVENRAIDLQEGEPEAAHDSDAEWKNWYTIQKEWHEIRDEIDRRATLPNIDGRTRAKYARIDKRQYANLIDSMTNDGSLNPFSFEFRDACDLWRTFKNGRSNPTDEQVARMQKLKQTVVNHVDIEDLHVA